MLAYSGFSFIVLAMAMLMGFLFFAERILFALAAYHDAQAQKNSDAIIWGLAVGFLGMIPGIIYLFVRRSASRMTCCPNCGYPHGTSDQFCPKCGVKSSNSQQGNPYDVVLAAKARKEFIGGIAVIAVGIMIMIVAMLLCSFAFMGRSVLYSMW